MVNLLECVYHTTPWLSPFFFSFFPLFSVLHAWIAHLTPFWILPVLAWIAHLTPFWILPVLGWNGHFHTNRCNIIKKLFFVSLAVFQYSYLYENDHFNQAQAEFKKELNGQSKPVAQKKRRKKRRVCTMHWGSGLSAWYTPSDHLSPSIALLLQLGVFVSFHWC